MRVLVCGGRDYDNETQVFETLSGLEPKPTFLIEGGASGADSLAWRWAKRNLPADCRRTVEADWAKHGRSAGPMRNQRMIDEGSPELVVAFAGGKGTADMVRRAKRAGIRVIEIG